MLDLWSVYIKQEDLGAGMELSLALKMIWASGFLPAASESGLAQELSQYMPDEVEQTLLSDLTPGQHLRYKSICLVGFSTACVESRSYRNEYKQRYHQWPFFYLLASGDFSSLIFKVILPW